MAQSSSFLFLLFGFPIGPFPTFDRNRHIVVVLVIRFVAGNRSPQSQYQSHYQSQYQSHYQSQCEVTTLARRIARPTHRPLNSPEKFVPSLGLTGVCSSWLLHRRRRRRRRRPRRVRVVSWLLLGRILTTYPRLPSTTTNTTLTSSDHGLALLFPIHRQRCPSSATRTHVEVQTDRRPPTTTTTTLPEPIVLVPPARRWHHQQQHREKPTRSSIGRSNGNGWWCGTGGCTITREYHNEHRGNGHEHDEHEGQRWCLAHHLVHGRREAAQGQDPAQLHARLPQALPATRVHGRPPADLPPAGIHPSDTSRVLTRSLTRHSISHSLAHSLTYPPTHLPTYPPTHLPTPPTRLLRITFWMA